MRKKLYKGISLGLCAAALLLLGGCAGSADKEAGKDASSTSSEAATASYTVSIGSDESYQISDTLYGIFLEDINYAVDGGLYAELIKNRSFEYGSAAANANLHGWTNFASDFLTVEVCDGQNNTCATGEEDGDGGTCLNENNTHYAVLTASPLSSQAYLSIGNAGYLDGLAVEADADYLASFYLKGYPTYSDPVRVSLESSDGTVYAEQIIDVTSDDWTKYECTLTPTETVSEDLYFCIGIRSGGSVCLDMVSLMPADTYEDLPIRKDIGEALEALSPSFLRFPGGCVIEGKDEESMYSWKDSIGNGLAFEINGETTVGDVAARPQGTDIWSGTAQDPYYTTYGIGFFEYFELCEALDCMPVPVLNAGMTCEIQSANYKVYALNSDEFVQCIQDALDLVEFCLGDETTEWGAIRIAMGHEEPFDLKYIAIGNEQWQSEYHAHYTKFVEAFEEAAKENPDLYADIELIVANGTTSDSTEGWTYLEASPDDITTLVDEHYYQSPSWFLSNTTRYDAYSRDTQAQVFLGEYAAQANTMEAALAEAAFMTGLEHNGDIVKMACYAPLFGNSKTNQWTPDLLFFSNTSLYGTVNYYVQQMFANNTGTLILPSELEVSEDASAQELSGGAGLGSWMTSVAYDNLTVTSNADGSVLYENDFSSEDALAGDDFEIHSGDWSISDGRLLQSATASPSDTNTGDVLYFGDTGWTDYTLTVDAEVLSGSEGFLIPVCAEDAENNIFWNIGGWSNTVSCLQIVSGGAKSDQVDGTVKQMRLEQNQVYQLKVVVEENTIQCYINDVLYVNYTKEVTDSLYETACMDNGDIILKLVNVSGDDIEISTTLGEIEMEDYETEAAVTVLAGEKNSDVNSFEDPTHVVPEEQTLSVAETFSYTTPAYSVNVIRISKK